MNHEPFTDPLHSLSIAGDLGRMRRMLRRWDNSINTIDAASKSTGWNELPVDFSCAIFLGVLQLAMGGVQDWEGRIQIPIDCRNDLIVKVKGGKIVGVYSRNDCLHCSRPIKEACDPSLYS